MKHYERLLTSLMEIEGRYIVVSESKYKYIFYDKKNEYELKFDKLWLLLEKKGHKAYSKSTGRLQENAKREIESFLQRGGRFGKGGERYGW